MEQGKTICELEAVVKGYKDNLSELLCGVWEDVESEWQVKLDEEVKKRQEKEVWVDGVGEGGKGKISFQSSMDETDISSF